MSVFGIPAHECMGERSKGGKEEGEPAKVRLFFCYGCTSADDPLRHNSGPRKLHALLGTPG